MLIRGARLKGRVLVRVSVGVSFTQRRPPRRLREGEGACPRWACPGCARRWACFEWACRWACRWACLAHKGAPAAAAPGRGRKGRVRGRVRRRRGACPRLGGRGRFRSVVAAWRSRGPPPAPPPGPAPPGAAPAPPGPRVCFAPAAAAAAAAAPEDGPGRGRGKVTVRYDRRELRKRLHLEEWILAQLTALYDCREEEIPELEIDVDELLDMESDGARSARVQEILVDCYKPTEAFVGDLLEKIRGMQKLNTPQKK
ncbi:protein phosphatase 1 regulatory subunit 14B [Chamaea fasciata]